MMWPIWMPPNRGERADAPQSEFDLPAADTHGEPAGR